jgi:DNA polymerase V
MADALALDLFSKNIVTDKVVLTVNYDKDAPNYNGPTQVDFYGRTVPKSAHGTIGIDGYTNLSKVFADKTLELYDRIVDPSLRVRAIYVVAAEVKIDDGKNIPRQLNIFTDYAKEDKKRDKEKRLQRATLEIKEKYGKNSILKAANYEESATMRMRNNQVGGHKA